jgi:hypothetical protein
MAKLKVIHGAISLGEFTVDELAEHTSVNATTVNTILARNNPRLFVMLRREKTGKPGGQPIVWKVDIDAARAYVAEHVPQGVLGARLQAEYSNLLWKVRDADPGKVRSLVKRARTVLDRLGRDIEDVHVQGIRALIAFAECELAAVTADAIATRNELAHAARRALSRDHAQLANAMLQRIEDSELSRALDDAARRGLSRSTTTGQRSVVGSSEDSMQIRPPAPFTAPSLEARRVRTLRREIEL